MTQESHKAAHGPGSRQPKPESQIDVQYAEANLARDVYCILGVPVDAIQMADVVRLIEDAVRSSTLLTLSTPNLNFLVSSLHDREFRESLLESDLCPADGMPIVWISRLLGLPIRNRIAGSDIFDALIRRSPSAQPIGILFFGATDASARGAAERINSISGSLHCVGWISPHFGSVEELSTDDILGKISKSNADFFVAALGAKKGLIWLSRNRNLIPMRVQAHLGATINFQAGVIKRAPLVLRKIGLEWLWRILQEPYLWKRYCWDGFIFLRLTAFKVLPLAIANWLSRGMKAKDGNLEFVNVINGERLILRMSGAATSVNIQRAIDCFMRATKAPRTVQLDFAKVSRVDARFLGLLLMLRKVLRSSGRSLELTGLSRPIKRSFNLHGLAYLLTDETIR